MLKKYTERTLKTFIKGFCPVWTHPMNPQWLSIEEFIDPACRLLATLAPLWSIVSFTIKMSNRSSQGRHHDNNNNHNKGFSKTHSQKKFAPKTQNPNPNPTPTLSTSLRQTQSSVSSTSSRGQNGNFVKYLPQDEAVAAGLGAEDGALDPLESQRVVDLLNTQLSRLLKLKPKQFWTQGGYYFHTSLIILFNQIKPNLL